MRSRPIVLISALVGAATALTTSAHAVGPAGTPVTECGTTITADAYLAQDLSCATGAGVWVVGSARLDLQGHTLTGQGPTSDQQGVAIRGDGDAEVRNGRITGFDDGVTADGTGSKTLRGVTIDSSTTGVSFYGMLTELNPMLVRIDRSRIESATWGIRSRYFTHLEISRTVVANSTWGADLSEQGGTVVVTKSTFQDNVIGLLCETLSTRVTDSRFTGQQEEGIRQYDGDMQVSGSTFAGNGVGWGGSWGGRTRIDRSTFTGNTVGALNVLGTSLDIERSTFRDNGTGYSGDEQGWTSSISTSRFVHNGDGVVSEASTISLRSVTATANSGWGIYTPFAIDLGGNRASGNGNDPQCVGVDCGPAS